MGERRGRRQVLIRPASKVVIKFLRQMQKHGYIGEFEVIDDHRSCKIVIELTGRLNKCGVISPRFDLKIGQLEHWWPQRRTNSSICNSCCGGVLIPTRFRETA